MKVAHARSIVLFLAAASVCAPQILHAGIKIPVRGAVHTSMNERPIVKPIFKFFKEPSTREEISKAKIIEKTVEARNEALMQKIGSRDLPTDPAKNLQMYFDEAERTMNKQAVEDALIEKAVEKLGPGFTSAMVENTMKASFNAETGYHMAYGFGEGNEVRSIAVKAGEIRAVEDAKNLLGQMGLEGALGGRAMGSAVSHLLNSTYDGAKFEAALTDMGVIARAKLFADVSGREKDAAVAALISKLESPLSASGRSPAVAGECQLLNEAVRAGTAEVLASNKLIELVALEAEAKPTAPLKDAITDAVSKKSGRSKAELEADKDWLKLREEVLKCL